jgi:hypothetical protein
MRVLKRSAPLFLAGVLAFPVLSAPAPAGDRVDRIAVAQSSADPHSLNPHPVDLHSPPVSDPKPGLPPVDPVPPVDPGPEQPTT